MGFTIYRDPTPPPGADDSAVAVGVARFGHVTADADHEVLDLSGMAADGQTIVVVALATPAVNEMPADVDAADAAIATILANVAGSSPS
jgi:hypothetical protein